MNYQNLLIIKVKIDNFSLNLPCNSNFIFLIELEFLFLRYLLNSCSKLEAIRPINDTRMPTLISKNTILCSKQMTLIFVCSRMRTEQSLRIIILDTKQEKLYEGLRAFNSKDVEDDNYLETKCLTTMTTTLMKDLEKAKSNKERNIEEYKVLLRDLTDIVKNSKNTFENVIIDLTFLYNSNLTLSDDESFTNLRYLIENILILDQKVHISFATGLFCECIEEKDPSTFHDFRLSQVKVHQFCASLVESIVENNDSRYTKVLHQMYSTLPKYKIKERLKEHVIRKIWLKREIFWCANLVKKSNKITFNPDLEVNESNTYFKILSDTKKVISAEHPVDKYKLKKLTEFKTEVLEAYLATKITSFKTMKKEEERLPDVNVLKYHVNQGIQLTEDRNHKTLETKISETVFYEVEREDDLTIITDSSDSENDSSIEREDKKKSRKKEEDKSRKRKSSNRDESTSSSEVIPRKQSKLEACPNTSQKDKEEDNDQSNDIENMKDSNPLARGDNQDIISKIHDNIQKQLNRVQQTMKKYHSTTNKKETEKIIYRKLLEKALAFEIATSDLLAQKFINTNNIGHFLEISMVEEFQNRDSELIEESSEICIQLKKKIQEMMQKDFNTQIRDYLNDTTNKINHWMVLQKQHKASKMTQWATLKTNYVDRNDLQTLEQEIKKESETIQSLLEDSSQAWSNFHKIYVDFEKTKKARLNQIINKVSPIVDRIYNNLLNIKSGKVYYIIQTTNQITKRTEKCSPSCPVTEKSIEHTELISKLDSFNENLPDDNSYRLDPHFNHWDNLLNGTANGIQGEVEQGKIGEEEENSSENDVDADGENTLCTPKMTNYPTSPGLNEDEVSMNYFNKRERIIIIKHRH